MSTEERERLAILQTILDNPDDLLARMIYADWLEEHPITSTGCTECGSSGVKKMFEKFIVTKWHEDFDRTSSYPHYDMKYRSEQCKHCNGRGFFPNEMRSEHAKLIRMQCRVTNGEPPTEDDCRTLMKLMDGVPLEFRRYLGDFTKHFHVMTSLYLPRSGNGLSVVNGFVGRVTCRFDTWNECGDEIVREHPVRYVDIVDRSPVRYSLGGNRWFGDDQLRFFWSWHRDTEQSEGSLTEDVWSRLCRFRVGDWDSEEDARYDLSTVLLQMSKERNAGD